MSRLIIKNIPSYITPTRLQEHFEGSLNNKSKLSGPGGKLTDVKVALKPDGTSRRFGFVGYKTEQEASIAREWFDRSFIDSTRISVSIVEGTKNAPAPRPNKRPRLGPSLTDEPNPASASTSYASKARNDDVAKTKGKKAAQLDEYMQVMQPRIKKGPLWVNELYSQPEPIPAAPESPTKASKPKSADEPTKVDVRDNADGEEGIAEDEQRDEGVSDLEWMRQRVSQNVDSSGPEKVFEQSDDVDNPADKVSSSQLTESDVLKDPTIETILQTSRLFLRNLAFSCTDADLMELCMPFGEVSQVHIPLDPLTKHPKGVAYITFVNPQHALAAYEALDRRSFQGRLLHILAAVDRKGKLVIEDGEGRKKSVKEEKEGKRKAMAGREFNWGMLYMNSDAVASSIADRMNIPKSEILNPDSSDNAAVKLALAETHVIQETKTYLESHGVVLSSFSSSTRVHRSDTIILVKNIPYGTTPEQIRELFEPHGELIRVLVPPAGTMGVVEFVRADEATQAFRAVAYRRMGNAVVYLEKGPVGMFADDENTKDGMDTGVKPIAIGEEIHAGKDVDQVEPAWNAGSTLFIKNLSFTTTTTRLTQVFSALPAFSFARVQTKPDPKRPGPEAQRLSMGYGFVGFKTPEGAKSALKGMQDFVLDGHKLVVKFAGRGTEEEEMKGVKANVGSKNRTTKMIVKNVPFEATKKDIRELFGAHGHLKSVRVPKKFDSRSRGFAFLEFVTRHEAENAFAALRHTHLLGRHLIIEWAEEAEQDLDVLRQKAGVGFGGGGEIPGRKRKLEIGGDKDDEEDLS